jgi:hypothetical protein|tara:strand:- start:1070 stop:1801 length:732 start_codon:yes stop_codon:yes gene_type:complete
MSVNSRENKELLWQLLSDHPFQKKDPKKFQSMLEYKVNETHQTRFNFQNNLMIMNKEIIKHFANELSAPVKTNNPEQLSKSKAFDSKSKAFDSKLQEQKQNFDTLMHKEKPKEIDFSDKTEDGPVTDRMVTDSLQQREQELKKIMQQYNNNEKSSDWLKGESTSTEKKLAIHKSTNIEIKPTIIDTKVDKRNEKHVHFNVSEIPQTNKLLSKLKKVGEKDGIINYLQKIMNNQEKIISLLERK